jgi:hypothetical protein
VAPSCTSVVSLEAIGDKDNSVVADSIRWF